MIKTAFYFIFLFFFVTDCTPATFLFPPHPNCRNAQYVSMYVFKDKTENTIINYCEMCFVSVFHRRPGIKFEVQQLDGKAHDQRRRTWGGGGFAPQPLRGVTRRHVVYLSLHYRGDVKCDGACTIRSCSLAKKIKKDNSALLW